MAFISLNIPSLVQQVEIDEQPHYHVRPLFVGFPFATNRRYDAALSRLQQEFKHYFKGFSLNRHNADHLLWFLFNPGIHYQQFEFDFQISRQFIRGTVGAASFTLQGHTFIYLPSFNNYLFMGEAGAKGEVDIRAETFRVAQQLLRWHRQENASAFKPEEFFSGKREFLTELIVNLHIDQGKFSFEEPGDDWFFSRLMEGTDFDGAMEIEKVGTDLNSLYPSGLGRAFAMEALVERISRIVFQGEHTPLAIIGPEGVGRHSLVHEVLRRYLHQQYQIEGKEPRQLQRLWHIDPTRIIAGMSIVGMWQKRLEAIIRYLRRPDELAGHSDMILIDNPVALLRIGRSSQNNMTLSDVLKPYLEKRQLQLLLIATPEEWKVIQERDRRFSDLFQVLRLQEPDLGTAIKILLQQRRFLEIENDAVIKTKAIDHLLTIHRNYLHHKALPGSIMKLMNQLAIKYRGGVVGVPEVRTEFKVFSGLEERIFDPGDPLDTGEVQRQIGQLLIGQPQAVESLADTVHLIRAKLADKSRPISSFLFIGPTGVGKTQAAKVLSHYLMGSEEHLLRFDMNEYIDAGAVSRLIGDYHQPEGQLTGKVRYQPFGILLLDEIEKAHPAVHDLLLQVLDEGRLTDSLGRTVDFTNTIIIMTSNIGAREINWQLGYTTSVEQEAAIYTKAVERHFRPEFINRIDKTVIFNPLELEHILRIARLQIKELLRRDGFVRRTTILNISQEALEWVARRGFDARMGGRALKRQIERDLTALSAEQLISNYSDDPIILNIFFKDDQIQPKIQPLQFVSPLEGELLPELPGAKEGYRFYSHLLEVVKSINEQILDREDQQSTGRIIIGDQQGKELNWIYYHFKNRVIELREQIETIRLGFSERFFHRPPAIPLRLKRSHFNTRRDIDRAGREHIRDRLFQEEGLREISDAYYYATAQFDGLKSEFVDYFLNVAFLSLFSQGLLEGRTENVTLSFESLITGLGKPEIAFLMEQYQKLFEMLDLPHRIVKRKNHIHLEGYSLSRLLGGEEGIHLFYAAQSNPIPIRISVLSSNHKENQNKANLYQVIRIYDGTSTLTDLRTGYSNAINITPNELKLLLYAGLDPQFRQQLVS